MDVRNYGPRGWLGFGTWQGQNEERLRTLYRLVLKEGGHATVVVDDENWMTIRVMCQDWSDYQMGELTGPRTVAHMIHLKKGAEEDDKELRDALRRCLKEGTSP